MNPLPMDDHSSSSRPDGPAFGSGADSGRGSGFGTLAPRSGNPAGTDIRRRNNVTVTGREDGPVLLLVHGFGCDQNMWRLVAPMLAENFRVVLFDYVGSGRSDLSAWSEQRYSSLDGYALDVLEVCEELDLREVTFVGHSVSAVVGVLAAARAPQRFSRLVMVAPSPRYIDEDGYRGGFSADDIDELLESLESNYLGWSAAMAPVIMGNEDRPELGQELAASFCATDPDMARVFARTTFLSDSREDLKTVAVPTLVLECTQDVIAPREVGAYVHAAIPGNAAGHAGGDRALSPTECSAGHSRGDHRLHRADPMMCRTDQDQDQDPEREQDKGTEATGVAFTDLLEDSAEELYEQAPCGYLSTLMDGTIAKINTTLLEWLGLTRREVAGRMRFTDLLTVGGKLYHETHFAPLLQMNGEVGGIALDIKTADGQRMPVLVTSKVKTSHDGEPMLVRTTVFDARDRRAYETELLRARQAAEEARRRGGGRPRAAPGSSRGPPAEPASRRTAHGGGPGGRRLLPHRLSGSTRRGFLRPVPPRREPMGVLPRRRVRQRAPGRRSHFPDPLHAPGGRSARPGPRGRADHPEHRAARAVPERRHPLLHRRLRRPPPRHRPRQRPSGVRRPSLRAGPTRRQHRALPAHPRRHAHRRPAPGGVHTHPHPTVPRRHSVALHRRPDRSPYRTRA